MTASVADPPAVVRERTPRRIALAWPIAAVVVSLALALLRLLGDRRFYFADDTQFGAFGQWYELGDRLRSGSLPVLNPSAWQAGNYAAEGQWGLLNPVTWVIALFARAADDAVVHVTVVKLVAIAVMSLGVYLLARSFTASPPWAAVAAVLVPAAGFVVYMDAPSWVTGLFCAAVVPWAWWGLRRTVEDGRGPLTYLAASYLLITFGYVYGAIILVVVLVESLVRAIVARRRPAILRAVLASVWGGLLTIAVYLPGVLTASVTERSAAGIMNTGFLNADLSDLASAAGPLAVGSIQAWGELPIHAPLVYIAWILPFFAFTLPVRKDVVRTLVPLFVLGLSTLLFVLGPSHLGPLRWPIRLMPYVALAVILVFAVTASRTRREALTWRRAAVTGLIVAGTAYLSLVDSLGDWRGILVVSAVQGALAVALVTMARRAERHPRMRTGAGVVAASAILVTVVFAVLQTSAFPRTPLPMDAVPASVGSMTAVLDDVSGDVITVGDVYVATGEEESFSERLVANLWYLSPANVSNLYTVLPFSAFATDLCIDLRGSTCTEALDRLWSVDDTTGLRVADLLGVSTIVGMRATFPEPPAVVPDGWSVRAEDEYTWTVARDAAVPSAGGVVWTGAGTDVTVRTASERAVSFTVDTVGADGRVTFSRLPWPGYRVSGANEVDPVRGWLLTVDVADAEPGDIVTIEFLPPGFPIEAGAYIGALLLLFAWPVARFVRRRRQSSGVDGSRGPVSSTAKE